MFWAVDVLKFRVLKFLFVAFFLDAWSSYVLEVCFRVMRWVFVAWVFLLCAKSLTFGLSSFYIRCCCMSSALHVFYNFFITDVAVPSAIVAGWEALPRMAGWEPLPRIHYHACATSISWRNTLRRWSLSRERTVVASTTKKSSRYPLTFWPLQGINANKRESTHSHLYIRIYYDEAMVKVTYQ